MPNTMPRLLRRELSIAAALLGLLVGLQGAQPAKKSSAAQPAAAVTTNTAPAVQPLPQSVFYVPTSIQDPVKDPFFPQSTRLRKFVPVAMATNVPPPKPMVKLELKGISGTVGQPLAIINSRTFGEGEEGDVTTGNGHARIRVVAISSDSVTVQVNGEQQVLHLRPGV
jgi:hypothetical protein